MRCLPLLSFLCLIPQIKMIKLEECITNCPIDCVLGNWSDWGDCTGTCRHVDHDLPTQKRVRRIITLNENGGKPCGPISETRKCMDKPNDPICPIDCEVDDWKPWVPGPCPPEPNYEVVSFQNFTCNIMFNIILRFVFVSFI